MITQFSIGNFRSFNEIQTINFRAAGLKSEDGNVDANNIVESNGQRILKTVGVYGPNGSGKSNLVKGFNVFCKMIVNSLDRFGSTGRYLNQFKQTASPNDEGYFQIILLLGEKKYRYGFTFGSSGISSEWLFGPAEKNETFYFTRKENTVNINKENFPEGINIPYETKLRTDALFLTFCSAYNGEISGAIIKFFATQVSNLNIDVEHPNTVTNTLVDEGKKEIVLKWLQEAGLPFGDIGIKDRGPTIFYDENGPYEDFYEGSVELHKNVYNEKGVAIGIVLMDLSKDESEGTQKYYSYIGLLHDKFEKGGFFISDEIDSNFHPSLLQKIIGMFNNPLINKANAPLLFTSHDTNLMNPNIMRRDQFYFTEKSATDATTLYSLADLKGIRNNADFAKQYLAGYYGALPVLGNYLEDQNIDSEK